jgi:hypothetical protein
LGCGRSYLPNAAHRTAHRAARTILINQISWGAVLAEIVIALTAQVLLNLLGVGIGLATVAFQVLSLLSVT